MTPKNNHLYCSFNLPALLILLLLSSNVMAVGDSIIESVMRSDFIFDRENSNVPFFPLAYLSTSKQDSLEVENCGLNNCEFEYQEIIQGLIAPVWVGQENMLVLGETLETHKIEMGEDSIKVNSAGVLVAWIAQPNEKWQVGAFVYSYRGLGDDELAREPKGNISGAVSRYRHSPKFHSYWGVVRFDEYDAVTLYPYLGFDWYIGKEWSIGGVLPWPTINYAPTNDYTFKFGALFSGSEWAVDNEGNTFSNDFDKVDFGISYEQRMWGMFWGEIAFGYSGFGKFTVSSGTKVEYESNISRAPFLRLSLNLRLE